MSTKIVFLNAIEFDPHPSFNGLVGVVRADITPSVGIDCRNWAAAARNTAQGIHRPLWLTVLAIWQTATHLPLVLLDASLGRMGSDIGRV